MIFERFSLDLSIEWALRRKQCDMRFDCAWRSRNACRAALLDAEIVQKLFEKQTATMHAPERREKRAQAVFGARW